MKQKSKRLWVSIRIILLVLLILLVLAVLAGIVVTNSKKSYPNLFVGEIAVGRMSAEETEQALSRGGYTAKTEQLLSLLCCCDAEVSVSPVQAGILEDLGSLTNKTIRYGKEGNIFENLFSYVQCMKTPTDLEALGKSVDYSYIGEQISLLQEKLNEKTAQDAFQINDNGDALCIYKGYGTGLTLETEGLAQKIAEALERGEAEMTVAVRMDNRSPDWEQLSALACKPARDACFSDDGTHQVISEEPGYSFQFSEAAALWDAAEPGELLSIPLNTETPTITKEYLESQMYIHLLGAMTTKYNNSNDNRSSNVRLATSLVNGTVLFPGEEFSFNDTVGKRTEEAGFLMAPAYAGYGDIQEELGGGVCQVSTGIYASALFAFLEITSHTCHIYPPNYIQLGTDATVSIPESGRTIDMKFKNNKAFPIKIVGYCEEGENPKTGKPQKTVTIEIWGTLEEDDYMPVEFDNAWGDVYDYDRKIEPAYEDRPGYRIQFTHDETEFEDDTGKGLRTLTYRRVYDAEGNVVEKVILNKKYDFGYGMDTYYYRE